MDKRTKARFDAIDARILSGTIAVTAATITAYAQVTYTTTITGAVVGDAVLVTPPADIAGTNVNGSFYAYVSAANTVTLALRNGHASTSWSLPAGTWTVRVLK